MHRWTVAAASLAAAIAISWPAVAAGIEAGASDDPPAGVIAWWRLDPVVAPTRAEETRRGLLESGLRAGMAGGLVEDGDALDTVVGLLTASALFSHPHRVVVLDVQAGGDSDSFRVGGLQAILEIRGPADHAELVRTIQAVLVDAPAAGGAAPGEQRTLQLPDGGEGVAFTRSDWPAWLEVSWRSMPGAFVVGIGRGALGAWAERDAGTDDVPWAVHRRLIDERRAGEQALELFLDLNALRSALPEWFGQGAASGLLDAWDLSNARLFMLHAHLVPADSVATIGPGAAPYDGPPVLAIDATWESRSDAPGRVRYREVAPASWPAFALAMPPPPGRFVMLAPARSVAWLTRAGDTASAIDAPAGEAGIGTRIGRWLGRQSSRLRRLEQGSSPAIVLADAPDSPIGLPILGALYVEADEGISLEAYEREVGRLLETLGDRVEFAEASRIWTVRLLAEDADPIGAMRVLAFGMAGGPRPVLVVAWSEATIRDARARLGAP